jgi:hypothetical protein
MQINPTLRVRVSHMSNFNDRTFETSVPKERCTPEQLIHIMPHRLTEAHWGSTCETKRNKHGDID